MSNLTHPGYRADIDGLRAVAVLSVVGFHAFPGWIKGGFIGVDIFFVISGYLISTIIFQKLNDHNFSFIEFYGRRIKRIFPALLLVMMFSYAFGWFALDREEFRQLGKHLAGGAGFVSNLVLWNESGYFDNGADTKPLLHLWSLGIEEQFYIFWPIALWLGYKSRLNLLTIAIVVGTISFGLNIASLQHNPTAAFYSPLTRIWELLAGSILAYSTLGNHQASPEQAGDKLVCNVQSLSGVALILAGLWFISREQHFPGWWALLPTAGAVLIISAGNCAWFNRVILSNRALVWIGLISFPLYLWHWPLLSLARIIESETPSRATRAGIVMASILLAWASYRLIESPIRGNKNSSLKIAILIASMLGVAAVGYTTYARDGLAFRQVAQLLAARSFTDAGGDQGKSIPTCGIEKAAEMIFQNCKQDSRAAPRYALLGDSKAASLYGGLVRTSTQAGRWLFIGGTGLNGAPVPVLSSNEIFERHQKHIVIASDAISNNKNIETVVLVTATRNLFNLHNIEELPATPNYAAALEGISNTIDKFIKAGQKVVLVVDNPTLPEPKDCIGRTTSSSLINAIFPTTEKSRCRLDLGQHEKLNQKYWQLLHEIERKYPAKVRIFDTTQQLCDMERRVCLPYKNGRLLYSFTDHISDYAAGLIGQDLNQFLAAE